MNRFMTKKLMFFGFLFFGISVLVWAQEENLSKARIFLPEVRWNFGYLPQGGTVSHIFQVKNIGEDTLLIIRVRPGCGCTTVPLFKDRLAPKETADLEVIFDSDKIRPGKTSKSIQIISSDPTKPIEELHYTANVRDTNSLVKLTPEQIYFDTLPQGNQAKRTFFVENISPENLSVKLVEEPNGFVDVNVPRRSLKPGEKMEITLGLKKNVPAGSFRTTVTLDFENSKMVRVTIPVSGMMMTK
jgi:hypothetical protein